MATDAHPTLVATWSLDEADDGIAAWRAFVAEAGVEVEAPPDLPKMLESARELVEGGHPPARARGMVMQRLAAVADEALRAAGRDLRMRQLIERAGEPVAGEGSTWLLVSEADEQALSGAGEARFAVSPVQALLWNLSTLPMAVAVAVLVYAGTTQDRTELLVAAAITYGLWFLARRWLKKNKPLAVD